MCMYVFFGANVKNVTFVLLDRHVIFVFMSGEKTARVIRYDMKKKEATVVMDKLFFLVIVMDKLHLPNGLDSLYSHM